MNSKRFFLLLLLLRFIYIFRRHLSPQLSELLLFFVQYSCRRLCFVFLLVSDSSSFASQIQYWKQHLCENRFNICPHTFMCENVITIIRAATVLYHQIFRDDILRVSMWYTWQKSFVIDFDGGKIEQQQNRFNGTANFNTIANQSNEIQPHLIMN